MLLFTLGQKRIPREFHVFAILAFLANPINYISGQTNLDALSETFSGSISSVFNFVYWCLDRFSNQWQSIYADQSQREANIAMNQWELTISWNLLFARSGAVVAQLASARLSKREVLSPVLGDLKRLFRLSSYPYIRVSSTIRKMEHWWREGDKGRTVGVHWYYRR